ncbi:hypothetical protein FS837_011691 [Tulasnella sp. UAMH 9824]|nr:hypothetical protein FS837_011691 [Tulasnella sp. UAMH 9824]
MPPRTRVTPSNRREPSLVRHFVIKPEPPSPAEYPQLEIRRPGRRFEVVGLVSTFFVFAITSGTATLILGWLYAFHDLIAAGGGIIAAVRNGTFVIREPSGPAVEQSTFSQTHTQTLRTLTFSALASLLVSLTGTVLVTLLAYRSASQWLRASENPEDINLTPIQYGLLVRTLGSGSLMSLINTLRYTCRPKRAAAPRLFKEAFVGVAGIYVLSHIVGIIDLWLHSRARSISVFRDVPVQSEAMYGITYNETTCGTFEMTGLPCQNLISTRSDGTYWADDQRWMYIQGFGTFEGTNPDVSLEYVNDTAILIPGANRKFKSQGFSINTHGLHVEHGTADFSSGWTSNPATTIVQLRRNGHNDWWNHDTPCVRYLNALDLYGKCKMTYLDIIAQYSPLGASWSIMEANLSSPELASVFWTPLMFQWGDSDLPYGLKPYMTDRGSNAMEMLEKTLGRSNMGFVTGLTKSS